MAFKLSLEISKNKVTLKSPIAFLKVLYNVNKIKKKISIDLKLQSVKQLQMSFLYSTPPLLQRTKYFSTVIDEAMTAFNNMLQDFGYTHTLELYDPHTHQIHPPQQHPLYH